MDANSEKDQAREAAELGHECDWLRAHAGAARALASSLPDEFDIERAGLESLADDMGQETVLLNAGAEAERQMANLDRVLAAFGNPIEEGPVIMPSPGLFRVLMGDDND